MTRSNPSELREAEAPGACATFPVEPTLEGISVLSEQVQEMAEAMNVPGVHLQRVSLAIDELLSNIILYGMSGDSPPAIVVSVRIQPCDLQVEVEHTGPAFDPFRDVAIPDTSLEVENRPVGGLGIFLVRSLMTSVHYERVGDRNRVTLTRDLETGQRG